MVRLILVLFLLVLLPISSWARDENTGSDTAAYVELLDRLKEIPVDAQVDHLRTFLIDHPETTYRPEIETNIQTLENLLRETDPQRKKEERDTERYLRALEFSKKLSPSDKIALWEQFLEENPRSIFRKEVENLLSATRFKLEGPPSPKPETPSVIPSSERSSLPVVKPLPPKDPQKATLLATFPGLVVPGLGHWYAKDYVLAGVLTGARVGGLGVLLPGIFQNKPAMIAVGVILSVFGYLVDIVDAPFAVARYNESFEQSQKTSLENDSGEDDPGYMFTVSLRF